MAQRGVTSSRPYKNKAPGHRPHWAKTVAFSPGRNRTLSGTANPRAELLCFGPRIESRGWQDSGLNAILRSPSTESGAENAGMLTHWRHSETTKSRCEWRTEMIHIVYLMCCIRRSLLSANGPFYRGRAYFGFPAFSWILTLIVDSGAMCRDGVWSTD